MIKCVLYKNHISFDTLIANDLCYVKNDYITIRGGMKT